jgi:hypothetical protein
MSLHTDQHLLIAIPFECDKQNLHAECHSAEWHSAEWHYAEWHYAERHYVECPYAEWHYADCRGTVKKYGNLFRPGRKYSSAFVAKLLVRTEKVIKLFFFQFLTSRDTFVLA